MAELADIKTRLMEATGVRPRACRRCPLCGCEYADAESIVSSEGRKLGTALKYDCGWGVDDKGNTFGCCHRPSLISALSNGEKDG